MIGYIGFSQENKNVTPPIVLKKLQYQDMVTIGDYNLKFSELISDSRCPNGVTCVWAGEVVIEVEIYKNNNLLTTETFNFPPTNYTVQERKALSIEDKLTLYLYNVMPAPEVDKKIDTTDYYLQFTDAN
ncbi:hypothetical protein BZARG_2976 [Bizionia argentinensis JUB59]|uniref:Uncharacterized protein n=1 Tax=Bizionia argentinensis JUB59 TaxID=1046627 RepID=G2ECM3_9FLAO|nr:hypothetical protein [Bizionia argentinensis]EGV43819.1 hypothetical protein BZARG_2976 [Bizionia argentinensis JUB59]